MKHHFPLCFVLTAVQGISTPAFPEVLEEITRPIEGKARRASSGVFDPESNRDAYHVAPGETCVLTRLRGPGEIRHMWFTISGKDRRYPRTLVLRIFWDGAEVPSVETPVGDFFAAGNGMRANLNSLPVQVTSYGRALNCYWRMPFREEARIEVSNEGSHDLCVYWQFDWMELPRAREDALYFHARYRQEFPAKPFSPYVICETAGEGHYVGTVFSSQSSFGSWFGESDDRFYIDGEEEASIVGTGTEDYFCDAWNLRLFSNPNTGVTIKEPNAEDCRFTAYRWHIQAPVTFRKSIKVDIERRSFCEVIDEETGERKQYDFKYRPDSCSSVAFWYQKGVAPSWGTFPPARERINAELVIEPAEIASEIKTAAGTVARRVSNRVCNQKQMLKVENLKVGGWFEVPCRVDEAGKYSISIYQCLATWNGIWKVSLRGPEGEILLDRALDFYDPYAAIKENWPENFLYGTWNEKKTGIRKLAAGDHVFRFECVGAGPLSRKKGSDEPGLDCGLDGISLRRFPWDDLEGWMEKYLVEEEDLFAARVAEAKKMVDRLDDAISAFAKDTGGYPASLEELLARPARLSSRSGKWPYVDRLERDPWGQLYRYEFPGKYQPQGFDVYSVHGDSRAPGGWIGNWGEPYRWKGAIEGEDLKVLSRAGGVVATPQGIELGTVPPLSGGKLLFIKLTSAGDWVELGIPRTSIPGAGQGQRFALKVRLVTSRDYGSLQLSLGGKALGCPVDAYSPKIATKTLDLGIVELEAGEAVLRLEAVGRNPRSAGHYAGLDALMLDRMP